MTAGWTYVWYASIFGRCHNYTLLRFRVDIMFHAKKGCSSMYQHTIVRRSLGKAYFAPTMQLCTWKINILLKGTKWHCTGHITHLPSCTNSIRSFSTFNKNWRSLTFLFNVSLKKLSRSVPPWSVYCSLEFSEFVKTKEIKIDTNYWKYNWYAPLEINPDVLLLLFRLPSILPPTLAPPPPGPQLPLVFELPPLDPPPLIFFNRGFDPFEFELVRCFLFPPERCWWCCACCWMCCCCCDWDCCVSK